MILYTFIQNWFNTQQEALCGIINGVYMSGPNYMRMCKIHNWSYDVKDYNDAIIEGLKLSNLKKEDIKIWKSIYIMIMFNKFFKKVLIYVH